MMRILIDNIGWKLFSLALSGALWFSFIEEGEVAASVPAAIQYRNSPQDLEISSDDLDRLYLKLRGPSTRLTPHSLAQTAVILDLNEVRKPGEQTFTLNESNIDLPSGVTLTRVIPAQIRLRFERRATKQVPVEVRFSGPPPSGFRVTATEAEPAHLEIVGAESRLEQISTAQTDAVDLSSAVEGSYEFRVPAFLTDQHVRFRGSPTVKVRVRLEKFRRE